MPATRVLFGVFEFLLASRTVHLTAYHGLEVGRDALLGNRGFAFGHQFVDTLSAVLVGVGRVGTVAEGVDFLLGLGNGFFCPSFHLVGVVEEVFDAHHVAMVGEGHAAHAVGNGFVDDAGDIGLPV